MEDFINLPSIFTGIVIGFFIGIIVEKKVSEKMRSKNGNFETKTAANNKKEEERDDNDSTNNSTAVKHSYNEFGDYKMVLVVRQDLGMGKGKAAAQCCHAAVDVYNKTKKNHPKWLSIWENNACPKVALKCPDENTIEALAGHARILGIDTTVIRDAGRTQIPSGSKTVIGLGPAPAELIDKVTGHLKLF